MTKKHYEAIAAVILFEKRRPLAHDEWLKIPEYIAVALADYFATDNPKFDRARFLQACGIDQIKEDCPHLIATAVYEGGKLQGKKCHNCDVVVKLPNQK